MRQTQIMPCSNCIAKTLFSISAAVIHEGCLFCVCVFFFSLPTCYSLTWVTFVLFLPYLHLTTAKIKHGRVSKPFIISGGYSLIVLHREVCFTLHVHLSFGYIRSLLFVFFLFSKQVKVYPQYIVTLSPSYHTNKKKTSWYKSSLLTITNFVLALLLIIMYYPPPNFFFSSKLFDLVTPSYLYK